VSATLYDLIPREEKPGNDVLLGRFSSRRQRVGQQFISASF
jgi:hypothetical protein